ncbi:MULTISPECIES: hypothetical protein [unclassified Roseovarius]|uniref:hypothetical protein n=1 Tax=unclassified Roseovarius TaxID=2614913 RepID=UPI00273DABFA|nr:MULTISPECIES: hypothetical protein [unclassified Roseovarius]
MAQSNHDAETERHARLFELIRQDNMVQEAKLAAPTTPALDLGQMQRFLKRADRSFGRDNQV